MIDVNQQCPRIVPPRGTLCLCCDDAEATCYCGQCLRPYCSYCRDFGVHYKDECDVVEPDLILG